MEVAQWQSVTSTREHLYYLFRILSTNSTDLSIKEGVGGIMSLKRSKIQMQPYLVTKDPCLLLKGNSPGETTGSSLERWPARLILCLGKKAYPTKQAS